MLFSLAWRNLGRHRRRTIITVLTMATSVAGCIGLSAWVGGFGGMIQSAIVDRQVGHLQVHHADYPSTMNPYDTVPDAAAVLESLRSRPDIKLAAPRVTGFALFGGDGEDANTGAFSGVDPAVEAKLTGLDERLVGGTWLKDRGTAVVGKQLADSLGLKVGGDLLVVTNALDGSFGDRIFSIAGISESGNVALDQGAFLSMADAQELLAMGDAVHELVVLTHDIDEVAAAVATTKADWPALAIRPWYEVAPEAVEAQGMQDASLAIFSIVILGLAAFIIINTLLMSVYERTRELGVLNAVGMRPRQIVSMILVESMLLGTLSAVAGLVLGGAIAWYLAEYGFRLDLGDGKPIQMGSVMIDPLIKGTLDPKVFIAPTVLLYVTATVGGLWPAIRASRLDPVTAMRQD
jgi:putative ABC transport system permease protein